MRYRNSDMTTLLSNIVFTLICIPLIVKNMNYVSSFQRNESVRLTIDAYTYLYMRKYLKFLKFD